MAAPVAEQGIGEVGPVDQESTSPTSLVRQVSRSRVILGGLQRLLDTLHWATRRPGRGYRTPRDGPFAPLCRGATRPQLTRVRGHHDLHPERIVTDRFTLDQADEAYRVADRGAAGKVCIVFA
jgi:hypothetical protein